MDAKHKLIPANQTEPLAFLWREFKYNSLKHGKVV